MKEIDCFTHIIRLLYQPELSIRTLGILEVLIRVRLDNFFQICFLQLIRTAVKEKHSKPTLIWSLVASFSTDKTV